MKLFENNESAQVAACRALQDTAHMTTYNFAKLRPQEIQDTIMEEGGDVRAIKAMNMYPDNVEIQKTCMGTLGAIAIWSPKSFLAMGRHGAIETMANALKRFPDNIQMQKMCSTLGAFLDFNGTEARENLDRVEKSGVTGAVLNALDDYSHDGTMVISALSFLSNACLSSKLKTEMIEHGFLPKSVALMQEHANATDGFGNPLRIRGEVIGILSQCFMDTAEARNHLVDAGLVEAIVGTMDDAMRGIYVDVVDNPRMQHNAMYIIRELARHRKAHKEAIVKAGAVNRIMAALNYTLAKPRQGCKTVATLLDRNLPVPCPEILKVTDEYFEQLARQRQNATRKNTT